MHYAVYFGKLDVVRFLVENGASVEPTTPVAKVTPLMLASSSTKEVATLATTIVLTIPALSFVVAISFKMVSEDPVPAVAPTSDALVRVAARPAGAT